MCLSALTPSLRSTFLGIIIVLFFQCIGALLNPVNRAKGGIKWPLVAHAVAMFSFVTIYTATTLDLQSTSYIDNREFPGANGISAGPLGYQRLIHNSPISVVPIAMFLLNGWLADGLLVSFVLSSVAQVSDVGCSSSFTVALLFIT
jgi:hypothetical protein